MVNRGSIGFLVVLSVAVAVAGCSGGEKKTANPPGGGDAKADSGATPTGDGSPTASAMLTDDECAALVRHVLVLGTAEMRATKPAEEIPTDDQIDSIVTAMTGDAAEMARCRQQPRWAFDCAMAATSTSAISACEAK